VTFVSDNTNIGTLFLFGGDTVLSVVDYLSELGFFGLKDLLNLILLTLKLYESWFRQYKYQYYNLIRW
jgi:hypothetical protein